LRQLPPAASSISTHRTFLDLVAQLDLDFLDHAGCSRRNFHRRLVRLHGDQALLGLDGIAGLDQHFNHGHFVEVANVRYLDFCQAHFAPFNLIV
jgi:hypothetical protein